MTGCVVCDLHGVIGSCVDGGNNVGERIEEPLEYLCVSEEIRSMAKCIVW